MAFFSEEILSSFVENITSQSRLKTLNNILIHLDNARAQNSSLRQDCLEATKVKRLSHPPYNPNLAPSDFFLVGYIKGKLDDYQCNRRDELKAAIAEIVNGIGPDTLRSVFVGEIKKRKRMIKNKGEYYHK
jgi:hypothetical protein